MAKKTKKIKKKLSKIWKLKSENLSKKFYLLKNIFKIIELKSKFYRKIKIINFLMKINIFFLISKIIHYYILNINQFIWIFFFFLKILFHNGVLNNIF